MERLDGIRQTIGGVAHGAMARGKIMLGMGMASQESAARRLDICLTCEHREPHTSVCNGCPGLVKCKVNLKVQPASEECPKGKWGKTLAVS